MRPRRRSLEKIDTRLTQLSAQMQGKAWIANDTYSVADGYLFVVMRWLAFFKIDLGQWPVIAAHSERVAARPAVQAALRAEHLLAPKLPRPESSSRPRRRLLRRAAEAC